MPLAVGRLGWEAVNNSQVVNRLGEPVRQVREPSEGFELRHSFYMQETVNWSSKLTISRERWSGIAACYVRGV